MEESKEIMQAYVKNLEAKLADADKQIADADKQIEDLEHKSVRDEQTGAYNRNYYETNKVKIISKALEKKQNLAIYVLDLDGLKGVNDGFGHEKGDKLLEDFVKILISTFRKSGIIIRFGGDEFVVIEGKVGDKTESKTTGRLSENVALYNKYSNKDICYQLSYSIGYAEIKVPKKNSSESDFETACESAFKSAFKIADDKMYKQKYIFRLRNVLINHINKNYSKINK